MFSDNIDEFQYVINPPKIPKVAFGSGLERITLPLSGPCMSSFMRKMMGNVDRSPGPTACVDETDYMIKQYPSKFGYSAFVNKTLRLAPLMLKNVPPPGSYTIEGVRPIKQAARPFGVGAPRTEISKFLTPGPPTYPYHIKRSPDQVNMAFGTQRKFKTHITIICTPNNLAVCHKCGKTPVGDYWHSNMTNYDFCRPCMNKKLQSVRGCKISEAIRMRAWRHLRDYKQVRYCEFFHLHNGTTAATLVTSISTVKFKIRKENYLARYMVNHR